MNERIKELAEQAGGHFGEGLEFAVVFGELEDFEKFAELFVRECINVVEDAGGIDKYHYTGAIGKHFGVGK